MARRDLVSDDSAFLDITDKGLGRIEKVKVRGPSTPVDFRILTRVSYEPMSVGDIVGEFGTGAREYLRSLIRSGYLEVTSGYY